MAPGIRQQYSAKSEALAHGTDQGPERYLKNFDKYFPWLGCSEFAEWRSTRQARHARASPSTPVSNVPHTWPVAVRYCVGLRDSAAAPATAPVRRKRPIPGGKNVDHQYPKRIRRTGVQCSRKQ